MKRIILILFMLISFNSEAVTTQQYPDGSISHLREIIQDNDLRYEQRFMAQESANALALAAQKEALSTALSAQKEASAKSEISAEQHFKSLSDQLTLLQQRVDQSYGKDVGGSNLWGYLVAGISLLFGAINIWALVHVGARSGEKSNRRA
jgi:hypothetical protein